MSIRDDRRARRRYERPVPVDTDSYADLELTERDARRGILAPVRRSGGFGGGGTGNGLGGLVRFLVFAVVLGGLVLATLLTVLRPLARVAVVGWAYDNAGALRIPFVADLVREGERRSRPLKELFALLIILHRMERVADQAKNICEETIFAATGETKPPKTYNILFVDRGNDLASQLAGSRKGSSPVARSKVRPSSVKGSTVSPFSAQPRTLP